MKASDVTTAAVGNEHQLSGWRNRESTQVVKWVRYIFASAEARATGIRLITQEPDWPEFDRANETVPEGAQMQQSMEFVLANKIFQSAA